MTRQISAEKDPDIVTDQGMNLNHWMLSVAKTAKPRMSYCGTNRRMQLTRHLRIILSL